jgi:hypothetical protein
MGAPEGTNLPLTNGHKEVNWTNLERLELLHVIILLSHLVAAFPLPESGLNYELHKHDSCRAL